MSWIVSSAGILQGFALTESGRGSLTDIHSISAALGVLDIIHTYSLGTATDAKGADITTTIRKIFSILKLFSRYLHHHCELFPSCIKPAMRIEL
jgi:hypothetical protein